MGFDLKDFNAFSGGNKKRARSNSNLTPTQKLVRNIIKISVIFIAAIICILGGIVGGAIYGYVRTAVPLQDDQLIIRNFTSIVYDQSGAQEIGRLSGDENREWIDIAKLPKYLPHAFVAIEDKRYYEHNGVDFTGFTVAVVNTMLGKPARGASTITMQTVKNITHEDDPSLSRKIQEQYRALQLEKKLNKDQILELYLNLIYLGEGQTYGIRAAAEKYFNKDVTKLTIAESACLAALPQGPSTYNPLTTKGLAKNIERRKVVLDDMLEQKYITQAEHDQAVSEQIVFASPDSTSTKTATVQNSTQSYFVDALVKQIAADFKKFGIYDESLTKQLIYNGGWKIYTTMDLDAQNAMDTIFQDPKNFPTVGRNFVASDSKLKALNGPFDTQAGMTLIDPFKGEVKALYGGFGKKETAMGFNYATNENRNPGSTWKPISDYGPGIDMKSITAATSIDDAPVFLNGKTPDTPYPKNSGDGATGYSGFLNVRTALAKSLNIPAVKIWQLLDFSQVVGYLKRDGITFDSRISSSVSFPIGGVVGISTFKMAAAYAPFVNKGMYIEPIMYTKIVDRNGNIIIDRKTNDKYKQVTNAVYKDEGTAWIMLNLMQGVTQPGGIGTANYIKVLNDKGQSIPTAGKTGTTDSDIDRWFCGITPYYVGSVWYGDSKNRPLPNLVPNPSADLWQKVMTQVAKAKKLAVKQFPNAPTSVVPVQVCWVSGKLPTANCALDPLSHKPVTEYFLKGTEPTEPCDIHQSFRVDTQSKDMYGRMLLANPACPPENVKDVILLMQKDPFHPRNDKTPLPGDMAYRDPEGEYCVLHSGNGQQPGSNDQGNNLLNKINNFFNPATATPGVQPTPTDKKH